MFIQAFPSGPFLTNAYVVACTKTRQAAIIDPAPGSYFKIEPLLSSEGFIPQKILLTHSHWDHIADVKAFVDRFALQVYVHPLDAPNLEKPGADGLPCWIAIDQMQPDVLLEEGMVIPLGELKFQVIHTPGHSPGCVSFYEPTQQVLFSGDTLFKGTIGNLSFPGGQPDLMWPSLAKLAKLPPETRVFPGHGEATTIRDEISWLLEAKKLFGKN